MFKIRFRSKFSRNAGVIRENVVPANIGILDADLAEFHIYNKLF